MDKNNVVLMHSGLVFNHKEELIMSFAGKWMKLKIIM
jgi:hypothetical protein